ncbi:trimeric intracellular cation channel family protein [Corynebacterium halotolerans]|uniref:Glycine transporter domain-containing protein n=1 Tax=Corynebacterium halotolerans YIM 70093 = DSM 44683 TaxID=1121362 RepID=M1NZW1_9CORY|nr:trimeric intracellular cation channel family protein [Corynebacterium halotolerans]AGF73035.1 hypothetical protein A605_10165 [Corynebacterium halotolerans YIM 70093 = DSM 44683]
MPDVDPEILALYRIFDLIGVVLNGIIGGTIARQRNYDIIGFLFLALFSALGGGMVRDTLMQQGTVAALAEPTYLPLAFGGALVALLVNFRGKGWELFKVHADAVILGVWAVTGCVKALSYDMPLLSAVFLGVVTAVGGGMIRDVFSGGVPSVFGGVPLYAIPAVLSAVSMVVFDSLGHDALGMIISPLLGIGLAVLSYWRGWVLPRNTEWAPVNMTAAQLVQALKRSEAKVKELEGRVGRRRTRNAEPRRRDDIGDEEGSAGDAG